MEENDLAKLEWPVPQRVVKWFGANVGSFGYRKIVSVPTDEMYRDMSAPISNETLTDTWRRVHIVERGFELVKELSLHDAAALFEMIDDLLNAKEGAQKRDLNLAKRADDFIEQLANDEKDPIPWTVGDSRVFHTAFRALAAAQKLWEEALEMFDEDDDVRTVVKEDVEEWISGKAWCEALIVLLKDTEDGKHLGKILEKKHTGDERTEWVIGNEKRVMKAMVENWDLLMPALSYFDADPPPKEQMEIVMGYDTMPLLLRLANKLVAGVQEKWEAGGMVMPRMWAVMFSEGMVEVRKKLTEAIGAEPVPDAPPKTCFVQIASGTKDLVAAVAPKTASKAAAEELQSSAMSKIVGLYSVLTASLLIVFVQHKCGSGATARTCSVSEVLKDLSGYGKFVVLSNFLTLFIFLFTEYVAWRREKFMIVHFAVVDFLPPNNLAGRLVGGSAEEEKRKAMQKKLVDEKEAAYARTTARMAYYLSCCFGSFSVKDEEGLKERKKIRLAHSLRKIRPVRKVFREIGKVVIKRKMVHPEPQPASPRKGDVEGGAPTPRRTQSIEHKVLEERKQAAQKIRDDAMSRMMPFPLLHVPGWFRPADRDGELSEYPNLEATLNLLNYHVTTLTTMVTIALVLNFCVSCGDILTPHRTLGTASFVALINSTFAAFNRIREWTKLSYRSFKEQSAISLYLSDPRMYNTISLNMRRPFSTQNHEDVIHYYIPKSIVSANDDELAAASFRESTLKKGKAEQLSPAAAASAGHSTGAGEAGPSGVKSGAKSAAKSAAAESGAHSVAQKLQFTAADEATAAPAAADEPPRVSASPAAKVHPVSSEEEEKQEEAAAAEDEE